MRRLVAIWILLAAALALPAAANAVIPSGNLIANGDAESGAATSDATQHFDPPGWLNTAANTITAVRYGTDGFLTSAQGAALGGGRSFFAGGPNPANDGSATISQPVNVGAAASEIDAGEVQMTLAGCLGGYEDQSDGVLMIAYPRDGGGGQLFPYVQAPGPSPAQRGSRTKLLPASKTAGVPAGTRRIDFELAFIKQVAGQYIDGYADNVSFTLQRIGTPPPKPSCSVPGTGGPGGDSGGGGTGGDPDDLKVALIGKSARLRGRSARFKLRCRAHEGACKGRVALSIASLPMAARRVKLGGTRYSIAAGKTKTIKVKLPRRARRLFKAISGRRLRRIRLRLTVTELGKTVKLKLRLRR